MQWLKQVGGKVGKPATRSITKKQLHMLLDKVSQPLKKSEKGKS